MITQEITYFIQHSYIINESVIFKKKKLYKHH